jgi:hypothetical protein
MVACRSSSENKGKMNLIHVLNKTSRARMELKLDVLGVLGKLLKYVVHSPKRKNSKKIFLFTQIAQTTMDQFLVSKNFWG